jgi:hypothetical protein
VRFIERTTLLLLGKAGDDDGQPDPADPSTAYDAWYLEGG